jgi:UDP-glucose 4-epimerase
MTKKTVAITGVAGFIGSNLALRLVKEGHHVIGIDNLSFGIREQVPDEVDFHEADIRDTGLRSVLSGADAIFHLAAKNCIADCQDDPVETASINVLGTTNILAEALAAGVKRFIYAESSALYEGATNLPSQEDDIAPRSFYSASKLGAMAFASAYERFYGMKTTALRYFCVYGPRQDYRRSIPPVMSAFIIKMLRGERPTIYGSGDKRRDFIHVDDVNDFHLLCLEDDRTVGGTYNLGSGTNHSVKDIFEMLEAVLRTGIEPNYASDLPGEAEITLADIGAVKKLGWEPKIRLKEGLETSIAYIRQEVLPTLP